MILKNNFDIDYIDCLYCFWENGWFAPSILLSAGVVFYFFSSIFLCQGLLPPVLSFFLG